ncbi:hypothetical protein C7Y47_11925 [Lysinibacillus sphaericus]|uniref:Transposase IS116/IS110/IS902 C-terminal domain-containing protein n=1 Tax=Lysinibacillus sphaericus TaxID=1421 RepID=A0A544UIG6_LYSSH|nr:hypothetical protein C7Y47_11925 [Lysinibacillus sp. SDF0037]
MAQITIEYEILFSVPGLGDATIVELLSEVGSFSLYENPCQLIKLSGLIRLIKELNYMIATTFLSTDNAVQEYISLIDDLK